MTNNKLNSTMLIIALIPFIFLTESQQLPYKLSENLQGIDCFFMSERLP